MIKYLKKFKPQYVLFALAAVFALAIAFCFTPIPTVRAAEAEAATLVYADDAQTVVSGVNANGLPDNFKVNIPAKVTEIKPSAFLGYGTVRHDGSDSNTGGNGIITPGRTQKLTEVTFEQGSALKKIGALAFAGTDITKLDLPQSVTDIGAGAFGQTALQTVKINSADLTIGDTAFGNTPLLSQVDIGNGNISFGADVFANQANDAKPTIIASSKAQFDGMPAEYKAQMTYPVTIKYSYLGDVIESEVRLHGMGYDFVNADGIWIKSDTVIEVGTPRTQNMAWYIANEPAEQNLASVTNVGELLEDDVDEVILYSFATPADEKLFIARNDIVYSGRQYALSELNPLLATASDRINGEMTVSIDSYVDPYGVSKAAPQKVGNAGKYTVSVKYGEKTATFTINIAQKVIDLASYSTFSWVVSDGSELMDGNGGSLLLYSREDQSKYPAYSALSPEKIEELGLSSDPQRINVRHSMVRNRRADVSVVPQGEGFNYTLDSSGVATASQVGVYTAKATLTADPNYVLSLASSPVDALQRGIDITVIDGGKSAKTTKVWYIVDMDNGFMLGDKHYTLADLEYGFKTVLEMPRLEYGDVAADGYGSVSDPVSLELYRNDTRIGGTFKRNEFNRYICGAMPVGSYELRLRASEVVSTELIDPDGDPDDPANLTNINHSAFEYSVRFNVTKSSFKQSYIDAIDLALKGKTFTYVWDGKAHSYTDTPDYAVQNSVNALVNLVPSKANTVWADAEYANLFDQVRLTYNLRRDQSDEYGNSVQASDADVYVVYYRVYEPNYYSSVENSTRTDYYFKVINVRAVDVPVVSAKDFNGTKQIADVGGTEFYKVVANDGGVHAGQYEVVLELLNPDCYMWNLDGVTLDNKNATTAVKFEIKQAVNGWTGELSVQNWIVGEYDSKTNHIIGSAKFGTESMQIVIEDSVGNVVFDSAEDLLDKLADLKVGVYRLRATVLGTKNYTGVSDAVFFEVYRTPGLPGWAVLLIVLAVLAVVALVIFILWKTGVFEILTDKIVLAIRTRASVDATIASVRAAKRAEEGRKSIEAAKAKERAEARRAKAVQERAKPAEERAQALEQQAQAAALRAERMRQKAENMQQRAAKLREKSKAEQTQPSDQTDTSPATETDAGESNNADE